MGEYDKKGFAGLDSLSSDVSGIESVPKSSPKSEERKEQTRVDETPAPTTRAEPGKEPRSPSEQKTESWGSGENKGGGGKWLIGLAVIGLLIWVGSQETTNRGTGTSKPSPAYSYPKRALARTSSISSMIRRSVLKN